MAFYGLTISTGDSLEQSKSTGIRKERLTDLERDCLHLSGQGCSSSRPVCGISAGFKPQMNVGSSTFTSMNLIRFPLIVIGALALFVGMVSLSLLLLLATLAAYLSDSCLFLPASPLTEPKSRFKLNQMAS